MADVQNPTRPNVPTGASIPSQQETRRTDEERSRTQGTGTGAQLRDRSHEAGAQFRDQAQEPQEAGAHMREGARDMGQQMREKGQELGMQAQHLGTQVKETASQYYEQGRESLQEWNRTLETQIREKPLQSLLIAGGIGLLLGLMWRRS